MNWRSWYKRFECFTFWQDKSSCDPRPWINFQLDAWITETKPFFYFASNDVNRWRSVYFHMEVSKRVFVLQVPFRPLPDHVPSDRQLASRNYK
jgi:hypothetical protein